VDHLLDKGFISFEDSGQLIVSPVADQRSLKRMGVDPESRVNVGAFSQGQRRYLDFHRENVLRMARAMNIKVKNVLLLGCEPETLGGEEGQMGLSAAVEAAVDHAVKLLESIINRILNGDRFDSNLGSDL